MRELAKEQATLKGMHAALEKRKLGAKGEGAGVHGEVMAKGVGVGGLAQMNASKTG